MSIPAPNHPRWSELLQSRHPVELRFLGARLTVGRLRAAVVADPACLPAAVQEVHGFFDQLQHLPAIQADLHIIFG